MRAEAQRMYEDSLVVFLFPLPLFDRSAMSLGFMVMLAFTLGVRMKGCRSAATDDPELLAIDFPQ